METVCSSEIQTTAYQTTRRHNLEDYYYIATALRILYLVQTNSKKNVSLCLIKHYAMKAYEAVDV
jgi:hypothetical protein